MARAFDEMKAVQRACSRATTLIGATAMPSALLERLWDHQFIHIVYHRLLEPGKPFDSSFQLYWGKHLSLLDIVQSQLPNAEFAFLTACHAAELTDESPSDEALHVAAAMQYCGFRNVSGTVWATADTDGHDLAENFYKSVFSGKKRGLPYHERTTEALRGADIAVVRLRRKKGIGMSLERWVNYVHYGAWFAVIGWWLSFLEKHGHWLLACSGSMRNIFGNSATKTDSFNLYKTVACDESASR
jgi:CHAT domain-containing protein